MRTPMPPTQLKEPTILDGNQGPQTPHGPALSEAEKQRLTERNLEKLRNASTPLARWFAEGLGLKPTARGSE